MPGFLPKCKWKSLPTYTFTKRAISLLANTFEINGNYDNWYGPPTVRNERFVNDACCVISESVETYSMDKNYVVVFTIFVYKHIGRFFQPLLK